MATYFITEQYVKDTSPVDENVDAKYLQVAILEAQDMYIHPLLGTTLYDELKTEIEASSVASLNDTLLTTYIAPCLKYYTLYEIIDILAFKLRNKNVSTQSGENSQPASTTDLVRLKGIYKDKAEWYAQRIIDYLRENETSYPNYQTPGTGIDDLKPNKDTAYQHGLYLGRQPIKYKGIDNYNDPFK